MCAQVLTSVVDLGWVKLRKEFCSRPLAGPGASMNWVGSGLDKNVSPVQFFDWLKNYSGAVVGFCSDLEAKRIQATLHTEGLLLA